MQFRQSAAFIIYKLSKELPEHFCYHNVEHTQDVYQAAELLGQKEGLCVDELKLLLTAACYHDAGFLKGTAIDHEEESCRIVKDILPGYRYTDDEIDRICGMIMATRLPQTPQNHLEMILADADLDYLGRDDFFFTGNKLFMELKMAAVVSTQEQWNSLQVRFLESHNYFTQTANQMRKAKKEVHLLQVKAKIK